MRLFDEHSVLRFALLFACFLFAAFIPDIWHLTDKPMGFIPYFSAIIFIAYVALFYKFPIQGNRKKIRNDVEIPERVEQAPARDYQKDLSEKDELFQMLVDVSSEGFWTFDVPTGKVYWSSRVAKYLNISPSSIVDSFDTLKNSVLESDWTAFREKFSSSLEDSTPFVARLRLLNTPKDGNSEIIVSGRSQCNEEGRPIRVIGSVTCATEQSESNRQFYAYRDALTGVYNRKFFLEKLKVDVDMAAQRPDYTFAVVLIDIDSFGAINESYSMNFGDNCF